MNELIDLLQHQDLVWQGSRETLARTSDASGYDELDEYLGGGFQKGVTEIQSGNGIGELRLLLPVLKNAVAEERLIVKSTLGALFLYLPWFQAINLSGLQNRPA